MIRRTLVCLFATTLLASCSSNEPPAAPEEEQVLDQLDPDDAVREAAMDGVRSVLKDPSSAEFEKVAVYREQKIVCGSVNSKNSFGAYTGMEDFVIDGETLYMASTHPKETKRGMRKCFDAWTAGFEAMIAKSKADRAAQKAEAAK